MASAADTALPARLIALVSSVVVALCLLVALGGGTAPLAGAATSLSALAQAPAPAQRGQPVPVAIDSSAHGSQRGEAESEAGPEDAALVPHLRGWDLAASCPDRVAVTHTGLTFPPRLRRLPPSHAPPLVA
ncbi:hypothetical protein [Stenotrophomonas sp. PS02289]|uniref:hypothetical protein n=1 Tax=Stenotrophomonas sp. PS02289 TaxID=2991422 RepID=UPI00249BAC21|nr:hypothetical protein [Stenotrophomonas sp. PS02289]